jgi:excinuclease UvrABC nuclease subunit
MTGRLKYRKKVAFNIINRMFLNGYILYKEKYWGPEVVKTRLQIIIDIVEQLSSELLAGKDVLENDQRGPPCLLKLMGQRQEQCCVCRTKEKLSKSYSSLRQVLEGSSQTVFSEVQLLT